MVRRKNAEGILFVGLAGLYKDVVFKWQPVEVQEQTMFLGGRELCMNKGPEVEEFQGCSKTTGSACCFPSVTFR
jgi:hypothetical protein